MANFSNQEQMFVAIVPARLLADLGRRCATYVTAIERGVALRVPAELLWMHPAAWTQRLNWA